MYYFSLETVIKLIRDRCHVSLRQNFNNHIFGHLWGVCNGLQRGGAALTHARTPDAGGGASR